MGIAFTSNEAVLLAALVGLCTVAHLLTNDRAVLPASGHLLSGHTLKRVVAAFAAWPVIVALAPASWRQNALQAALAA